MKKVLCLVPFFLGTAWGEPKLALDLATVERNVLGHSPQLAATRESAQSAEYKAGAQRSRLWPTLSIDGSYRYQTEVPSFQPNPLAPPIEMGDNPNYSIGPALTWLAWDSGGVKNSAQALSRQASARSQDARATQTQLILNARIEFFQLQGLAESLRLLAEGLRLAQAQRDDVQTRTRAGAASRQDLLQAETEVLSRQRDFRETQTIFAVQIRGLLALMGAKEEVDLSRPLPEDLAERRPRGVPAASLVLGLPAPNALRAQFEPAASRPFSASQPEIRSLALQVEAAEKSARAARAGHGPTLQLAAKTSRDYPNGPIKEDIHQNTLGAVARWSLFEGKRVTREVLEQESLALATEEKRRQVEEDLTRDWQKARDRLAGLKEEERLNTQSAEEQRKLSKLIYESYALGRATFLEVQAANLGLLKTQVQSVRTEVDILTQLALLDRYTTEETP